MFTTNNSKQGLVKTQWKNIREDVKKVEPVFTKLVDALNPNKNFSVYLAYFPYGALKGDTKCSFLPLMNGEFCRLDSPSIPNIVKKDLGYGIGSSPFGMVLDKNFEYFFDLKHRSTSKPQRIATPGSFFPLDRLFTMKNQRVYSPNGILSVSSGARSVFMLPCVSRELNHSYLQRDLGITSDAPISTYDHWRIFKEITSSQNIDCNWRSCIIYFSENWISKLTHDPTWRDLKLYLYEKAWNSSAYSRSANTYYEHIFSEIKSQRNLKLKPYIEKITNHIFKIILGAAPGFSPQINNNSLPIKTIQNAYTNSYSLKNYWPTILSPERFVFEQSKHPIYYSLQHGVGNDSNRVSSPSNILADLREVKRIFKIYFNELASTQSCCVDTVLNDIANRIILN
ncbi:MAG: hypothetical protein K0U12_04905, partial [Gammaproteobacteria bacterium]|nr:hypothetical protein [Gammaproteobacteria bacterium]